MKKLNLIFLFIFTGFIMISCGTNKVDGNYKDIGKEAANYAAKIENMTDISQINQELDQCSKRINFHAGQIRGEFNKLGTESARSKVSATTRIELNKGLTKLMKACIKLEKKFGSKVRKAIQKIKDAIRSMPS